MPNHLHVLFETFSGHPLGSVVHSWKTFTARTINKALGRSGKLWQDDYFDTYIRDDAHLGAEITYIEHNPVKAGLAAKATDWPWSSAARRK